MSDLNQTIANLSPEKRALLERGLIKRMAAVPREQPIPRRKFMDAYPLSFAQQRLWFLEQLEPGSSLYHIWRAVRLSGRLNVEALRKTLEAMVERHESLRTRIVTVEGRPLQVIGQSWHMELPVVELSQWPDRDRETEALRLIDAEVHRPFDLTKDLMLRALLVRLGEEENVLVMTTHHIASDGWSMGILFREISVLYKGYVKGEKTELGELPIQYADYAMWQREWLQGGELERQLGYWKQNLIGLPVLRMPTDRGRPATQGFRGGKQKVVVSRQIADGLKVLSRREGVTLFMTLLAAFQVLLHRYSGQEEIVVGTPIAGRSRTEIEGLIGFFVNTLVLRTDVSSNPSFRELLTRVREVALGAYVHQDLPFEKLVEEMQPERTLSHNPLFQVMFVFQNTPRQGFELQGLKLRDVEVEGKTAKFDLTLFMIEKDQGLETLIEYSTDLFDDSTITRMLKHFHRLLEGAVTNPDQRISELQLLSEPERHQLLIEWNATERKYPREQCIHQLFEAQVERNPKAVAVVYEDQHLTYYELNARANQLAHYLKKRGVGAETLVGICVERSVEMIVGVVGILKTAGAYVPLDPGYPRARLSFMLEDGGIEILISQETLKERLVGLSGAGGKSLSRSAVICMDRQWKEIERESRENPSSQTAMDESLSYVMYTSGSTGKPKGVGIPHRGVVRLVMDANYVRLGRQETLLQMAPISFDASTFEIWGALLHGGQCVLFPETIPSSSQLGEEIRKQQVGILWLTASLFNTVIDEAPEVLKPIRQLLIGGEALSAVHVRRALEVLPATRIINGYGPTENTTFTCCYEIPREGIRSSIPIGRSISSTQVYILDDYLNPVPVGVPGELYAGGDGLARGYVGRPELTAEKFVPHPFSELPGARLYRTGDLARYLPDGNIEFLGRADHQVKIRGFRIELEEIEAVLCQHPYVNEAIVLAREDGPGEKRLVTYVVPKQKQTATVSELSNSLKQKLPDYMIPSAFVLLDRMPLTPNGKVDRKALPKPNFSREEQQKACTDPRNSTEQQLIGIWEEVLNVRPIGVTDNFFGLGGTSILAVRLVAKIEKVWGKKLPLSAFFQAPTVEETAQNLGDPTLNENSCVVVVQPKGRRRPFFCVHGYAMYKSVKHLGEDQPFYGLVQGMDGRIRHTAIEDLAALYLKDLRRIQATGPYLLGGHSFGGLVAFEMAHQLLSQGETVGPIFLLDPTTPLTGRPVVPANRRSLRLRRHITNIWSLRPRERLAYAVDLIKTLIKLAKWMIKRSICEAYLLLGRPLPKSLRPFYVTEILFGVKYVSTARRYVPKEFSGRIVLFCPENSKSRDLSAWKKMALGGLEVHWVPGNHLAMLDDPNVRVLLMQLRDCLDEAQTTSANT